jgi:hypothetical protein
VVDYKPGDRYGTDSTGQVRMEIVATLDRVWEGTDARGWNAGLSKGRWRYGVLSSLVITVVAMAAASGGAGARHPGNCYCADYEPYFPSAWLVEESNPVNAQACGYNSWETAPFDDQSTGEVGADQLSDACGPSGNYEQVTSLGWKSADWTWNFITGDPVTFEFNWNIDWASVQSVNLDTGECGGSGSSSAQIALTGNVYDVSASRWVFNPGWTSVIWTGDYNQGSIGVTGYQLLQTLSWATVSSVFNSSDQYYMIGLVVLETQSIVDDSCGDVQSYMNAGDNGGGAWLYDMEWFSS